MPISILPSRRDFLAATGLSAAFAMRSVWSNEPQRDAHRFALLADLHIPTDRTTVSNNVNMVDNLTATVKQLGELVPAPTAALLVGDCAHLLGNSSDYRLLAELMEPLTKSQMPLHLLLGNHDHRQNCLDAFPAELPESEIRLERRVALIPAERANWFLLDSLDQVNKTPGTLGVDQLRWLTTALDENPARPALIAVHHHPTSVNGKVPGITDSEEFLNALADRKQVKAIFFGHTHVWSQSEHRGIHLINLPPVAYVFSAGQPNGWVDCQLGEHGAELRLVCHDSHHLRHNEKISLAWRT